MLYFRRCAYTLSAHSNVFLRKVGPVVMGRVIMGRVVMDPVVMDPVVMDPVVMRISWRGVSNLLDKTSKKVWLTHNFLLLE